MELNAVYKQLISTNSYENFDLIYYDVPLQEAIDIAGKMGL
jgi:hypothetical protein